MHKRTRRCWGKLWCCGAQFESQKLRSFLGKGEIQDRVLVRRRMVRAFVRTHCPEVSDSWVRLACNLHHKKIAMEDKEKRRGWNHHDSLRAAHQRLDPLVTPMAPPCHRSGASQGRQSTSSAVPTPIRTSHAFQQHVVSGLSVCVFATVFYVLCLSLRCGLMCSEV